MTWPFVLAGTAVVLVTTALLAAAVDGIVKAEMPRMNFSDAMRVRVVVILVAAAVYGLFTGWFWIAVYDHVMT